jgi:serine/threonine protein kinase
MEPALFAELFGPPKELKGRYVIQSPLREGAQVSLFRALDRAENRVCLVHQVSLSEVDLDRREVAQYRFLQEAAAWQKRRHPNIIQVLDAEVQNNRLYLVT